MAEKTTVVNVRLPEHQARWLRKLADVEHGGNLSAAARKALADGWMMRRAREEYESMRIHEGFSFPPNEDGSTRGIQFFLSPFGAKSEFRWEEEDAELV
jgi:hypothetical protein